MKNDLITPFFNIINYRCHHLSTSHTLPDSCPREDVSWYLSQGWSSSSQSGLCKCVVSCYHSSGPEVHKIWLLTCRKLVSYWKCPHVLFRADGHWETYVYWVKLLSTTQLLSLECKLLIHLKCTSRNPSYSQYSLSYVDILWQRAIVQITERSG